MSNPNAPYITVTQGMSGYFAVMLWLNREHEDGLPDFWEPYTTGIGRYAIKEEAIEEAKQWAADEELEYKP